MKKTFWLIVVLLMIFGSGCQQNGNKTVEEQKFNEKQIVGIFSLANITLTKSSQNTGELPVLNGCQPLAYQIKNWPDSHLYLYLFDTMDQRQKIAGWNSFNDDKLEFDNFAVFTAKNALILYTGRKNSLADYRCSKIIGEVVWNKLNEAKTINYQGEGKNWRGTYQVKYFQHFIEEKGRLSIDAYHLHSGKISFKGNPADVGPYSYSLQGPGTNSRGSESQYSPGKDNMVGLGGGGGNGAFSLDEEAVLTIKWAGKSETIHLKKQ